MKYRELWVYVHGDERSEEKNEECVQWILKKLEGYSETQEIIKNAIIEAGLPKSHAHAVYQCEEMLRAAKAAGWEFVKVPSGIQRDFLDGGFWEKDPEYEELKGLLPYRVKLCATESGGERLKKTIETLLADNHAILLARMGDREDDSHQKDTLIWELQDQVRQLEKSLKSQKKGE